MDRYFDTPEAKFDLDIFEEAFDLLIKYNDRDGVGTFWRLMEEMGVEPPDEMREKVCMLIPWVLVDDHVCSLLKETTQEQSILICAYLIALLFFSGGDIPSEIKRSVLVWVEISREALFLNS